jgi:hypothetical protein
LFNKRWVIRSNDFKYRMIDTVNTKKLRKR